MSDDTDLNLLRELYPENNDGGAAARQRARARLLHEISSRRRAPRRHRLRLFALGGTAMALAAAMIVIVLVLSATSATSPAYALTPHGDGTVTLTLYRLTNDIPALNARLAQMGIDETIVPVTPTCTNQAPIYPVGNENSTITLYVGRKYLLPGFEGVLAAQTLPNGKVALVQGALHPADIPSCFATIAHTHIEVLPATTG